LRQLGLLAIAIVVAAGGVMYALSGEDVATAEPVAPATTSKPATVAASPSDPSDATVPTQAQLDEVAHLLGDARRLAQDGKIDQAKAAVDKAAKIIPGSSDIAQARVDIEQLSTPQYRLADQLTRARLAVTQDDWASAEAALQSAASIDPSAPQIAQLRQQMQDTRQKQEKREQRIAALLEEMRQAIATHDLVAADRALNEAERLNIRDPAIDPARVELARAQEDAAHSRQR
jgi:hypothetical protein